VTDEKAEDEVLSVADLRKEQPVGADGVSVILGRSWNREMMRQGQKIGNSDWECRTLTAGRTKATF
jgi:hypothetical protein